MHHFQEQSSLPTPDSEAASTGSRVDGNGISSMSCSSNSQTFPKADDSSMTTSARSSQTFERVQGPAGAAGFAKSSTRFNRAQQAASDAALHQAFERADVAGESFDYGKSTVENANLATNAATNAAARADGENFATPATATPPGMSAMAATTTTTTTTKGVKFAEGAPDKSKTGGIDVMAYLQQIQRGSLIQDFGCLLTIEEESFKLLAFSDNVRSMLIEALAADADDAADSTAMEGSVSSSLGGSKATRGSCTLIAHRAHVPSWFQKAFKSSRMSRSSAVGAEASAKEAAMAKDGSRGGLSTPGGLDKPPTLRSKGRAKQLTSLLRALAKLLPAGRKSRRMPSICETPNASLKGVELEPPPACVLGVDFGMDIRPLFTPESAEALQQASLAHDVSVMNPVLVQSASTGRPFYAILHRIDVGLLIDFEPVSDSDPVLLGAGALQAHKLAGKAMARLQKLPPGDLVRLCETLVQEVRELVGYDRVMCYKFHADEHGEVLAESRREDMEPYLGLHYPATDIPQAARFLFMKNRVRIIANTSSKTVNVHYDETKLEQPVTLTTSTLRAVHGCHIEYMKNMGTDASLVFAVVVNNPDNPNTGAMTPSRPELGKKLWGLVVCHHEKARHIAFPLRLAGEYLMQVFSMQVNREIELANQVREKDMLRTQSLLCELLLREAPLGIVSSSPNMSDLVRCDGAALVYGGRIWRIRAAPSEPQILQLVAWLDDAHAHSSGLSTDSLVDAGFPLAGELGGDVCGMAAARLLGGDFLFWFRAHVERTVKWSGAKNDPSERDDARRMGPRASFNAFLEVVRHRSEPWEDVELDAVHSLQTILLSRLTSFDSSDLNDIIARRLATEEEADRVSQTESQFARVLDSASAPILAVDSDGCITGWNLKMAELTGLSMGEALGKSLVRELCSEESRHVTAHMLQLALQGHETKSAEMRLTRWDGTHQQQQREIILVVNAFANKGAGDEVVGVCFLGQDVTRQRAVERSFTKMQGDYTAIINSHNSMIPPIFAADEYGWCTEWNAAMEKTTGIAPSEAVGKMLMGPLFGGALRMKTDALVKMQIAVSSALSGTNTERHPFLFLDCNANLVEALLTVHARKDSEGAITGVFCFLHIASPELQQALALQRSSEEAAKATSKAVAYIRQEMKGPLHGLETAVRSLRHATAHMPQNMLVPTMQSCERQMALVAKDEDIGSLQDGFVQLESEPIDFRTLIKAVVCQGQAKGGQRVTVFEDVADNCLPDSPSCSVLGDSNRLQQALAALLVTALSFVNEGGWVRMSVTSDARSLFRDERGINFEFNVIHSGKGVPNALLEQMASKESSNRLSQEGLTLNVARSILLAMGGSILYSRKMGQGAFVVKLTLPMCRL